MPIFVLFVSAEVLFDDAFSLWVSLINQSYQLYHVFFANVVFLIVFKIKELKAENYWCFLASNYTQNFFWINVKKHFKKHLLWVNKNILEIFISVEYKKFFRNFCFGNVKTALHFFRMWVNFWISRVSVFWEGIKPIRFFIKWTKILLLREYKKI